MKQIIKDYFANPRMNQSVLKTLLYGLPDYRKAIANEDQGAGLHYSEKGHLIIGSAVDAWLTQGYQEFKADFHVPSVDLKKPSDAFMSITKYIFDRLTTALQTQLVGDQDINPLTLPTLPVIAEKEQGQALILEGLNLANEKAWNERWTSEKRIERVLKDCSDYWEELKLGYKKQILSAEEFGTVQTIVNSFLNWDVFNTIIDDSPEHIKVFTQKPINHQFEGIDVKGLLDIIRIDFQAKIIYIYDLKTTVGKLIKFLAAIRKYRYDFQMAFYRMLATKIYEIFNLNPDEWQIKCAFLVESTTSPGTPIMVACGEGLLEHGMNGRPRIYNKGIMEDDTSKLDANLEILSVSHNPIYGIKEATRRYKWYMQNGFEKDYEIAIANQRFVVTWDEMKRLG